jgi:hypothetical protein
VRRLGERALHGAAMIAANFLAPEVQLEQQCDERALAFVGSLLG